MKKILFYFIFVVLQILIFFTLGEIAIRIFKPQKTYSDLQKMVGGYYQSSPTNYLRLKPKYLGKEPSQEHPGEMVSISINSMGLRGDEVGLEKATGTKRVLILGDSYTFGVFVNNYETYAAILQKELRGKNVEVEVLNAGYADGFETDQEYTWLVNEGLLFKPDVVIYGFFVGNDISGINQDHWKKLDNAGLPVIYQDPDLYIDNYGRIRSKKADNKTVGAEAIYRVPILRESHLCIAIAKKIEIFINRIKLNIEHGRSMPPGYSVVFYPQLFKESASYFYKLYEGITSEEKMTEFSKKEDVFKRLVTGMRDRSEEHGAQFLIAMIPFNFQVEPDVFIPMIFKDPLELGAIHRGEIQLDNRYFDGLKAYFSSQGINSFDILELMKKEPGHYFPRNGEVHFNPDGHYFVGTKLAEYLTSTLHLK